MVSSYHDKVRDYIYNYGKKIKKVKQVFKEKQRPIPLPYPFPRTKKKKITTYYEPDVYYILKYSKKYVIFETVKSQQIYKTISDFVRSYLCLYEIHSINFITHDKDKRTEIMNTLDVIQARLKQKIIEEEKKKFEHRVVFIPKSIIDSEEKVYSLLDDEIKRII